MHKSCWSGVLLIALAASTSAQAPRIARTPLVDRPALGAAVTYTQRTTPFFAMEHVHADTATRKSRRRQVIGATLGALVGAIPGGAYALLEGTSGCKVDVVVPPPPCTKPGHLWVYPVGGAAAGAALGALIARL